MSPHAAATPSVQADAQPGPGGSPDPIADWQKRCEHVEPTPARVEVLGDGEPRVFRRGAPFMMGGWGCCVPCLLQGPRPGAPLHLMACATTDPTRDCLTLTGSRGMYLDRDGDRWRLEQVSSTGFKSGEAGSMASGELSLKATHGKQVRTLHIRAQLNRESIGDTGASAPERTR